MKITTNQPTTTHPSAQGETMKAIVQHHYGTDPLTVLEYAVTSTPSIADDQLLVRVVAASVDMGTWHCMTGMPYAMRLMGFGVRAPKSSNPGRAFAGTVVSAGRDVTTFEPGDEVYGTCNGSLAEFVAADVATIAGKPANLSFEQAAAAPISGATALQAIRKANIQPSQTVLIVGASGGVGTFTVQLAKAAGAEVTGVCRTGKVDLVRSLGADHVIDYAVEDFTNGAVRYDVIVDTGGNRRLRDLRRVLADGGTLVVVGGETGGRWLGGFERSLAAALLSPFVSQTLRMLASKENGADLEKLRGLIESGSVTPAIDRTYSMKDSGEAINRVRAGAAAGKTILTW
jgi:NADPH:quinone reductase-like Zn-dependent oxidoreductase